MKEHELFGPVKNFLIEQIGCRKVYAEVCNHDVVGIIGEQIIIVEMKMQLSFKIIEQAIDAKRHANYAFIAVPSKKGGIPRIIENFLKHHGIGLIVIEINKTSFMGHEETHFHAKIPYGMFAKYNRNVSDIRKYIKDGYHDTIKGGYKMGDPDFDYKSDYTLMIENIRFFLQMEPERWFTVEEIINHCHCYYANPKPQLTATLRAPYNSSWIEQKKVGRKPYFKWKETCTPGI